MYVYDPSSTVFTDKYNLGLRKWMDVLDVYLENANCWNLEFPPHILQVDNISCGIYVCYYVHQIVSGGNLTVPLNTELF